LIIPILFGFLIFASAFIYIFVRLKWGWEYYGLFFKVSVHVSDLHSQFYTNFKRTITNKDYARL
jgi:hypothetical protein